MTLKIAIKRDPCKLACTWPSVSDLSKASPFSSHAVRSTPGDNGRQGITDPDYTTKRSKVTILSIYNVMYARARASPYA